MKRTNSIPTKIIRAIGALAILIAIFSNFSISAQSSDDALVQDVAPVPAFSDQTCYTPIVIDCGLHLGEQIVCNFNHVYGKPYFCTEYSCYGTRSERECVLKAKS